ncbi:MAG: BACON domain-containing carbohydrate-binding protein [Acidobacteriota bacterium]
MTTRTGALSVAGIAVTITQQGQPCTYAVTPADRTFGAAGGTGTIDVVAPGACAWTAASSAEWLTIASGARGMGVVAATSTGSGAVTYQVAANPDAGPRSATIEVAGATHTVRQAGAPSCAIAIAPDDESLGPGGGAGSFSINAAEGCAWVVQSTVEWIRVTSPPGGSGTGSGQASYVVDENAGLTMRTGTLTVGERTFLVSQSGLETCTYVVSPTSFSECLRGGERTVSVDTQEGCAWTAKPAAGWLAVLSGQSGSEAGTIRFSFTSNYLATREANIEVRWAAPTLGQNVRVVQTGCLYAIVPDSIDLAAAGGDFAFNVFASPAEPACGGPLQDACVWSAVSGAPWVTILTSMPRNGDDRVTCRAAPNATGAARTAPITIGGRTFVVRQGG